MAESQTTFTINGVTLEMDFLDADVLERFYDADEKVIEALNDTERFKGKSQPEQMRMQCEITEQFFDDMFGAGTAAQVFEGKHSHLGEHAEAFTQIVKLAQGAPERINKILGVNEEKPAQVQMNREQRRAAERQRPPQPGKQVHYDNYKDRLTRPAPAVAEKPEQEATDPVEEELKKEGITKEQFEQAIELLKKKDGQ